MDTSQILDFLKELQQNNNKEWMDQNRSTYMQAKDTFLELIQNILNEVTLFDSSLAGISPKNCIFRINRDIRFSKDKSPYKNNFGAAMAEGGKKSPNAIYYLHLQPNNQSFLAGGLYMPAPAELQKVRQEIDYNPEELKNIVSEKSFKKYFGEITGEKLKNPPKGYETSHPNIELLKHKSFLVSHPLSDKDVISKNFIAEAVAMFHAMFPFNRYFNVAIS